MISITTNKKIRESVLYIINKCGNNPTFGLKVLHKLMYFSDINYYKKNNQSITGAKYLRLVHGPFVKHLKKNIAELEEEGFIETGKIELDKEKGIEQNTFQIKKDFKIESLNELELAELNSVCEKLGKMNGNDIENLAHKDTPWQVTDEDEVIDFDLVFYRSEEISKLVE